MGALRWQHPAVLSPYSTLNAEKLHQVIPGLQGLVLIHDSSFLL